MDQLTCSTVWKEHEEDFLNLLRIPSVYQPSTVTENTPYGKPVHDALMFMKEQMDRAGFETEVYDNVCVSGTFGAGEERIDIASHLDVVEPGDHWDSDPFEPIIRDGRIIARGSQDMKSGAWLTFLALKRLKEEGFQPKRRLRLVYGSDEERTMEDMRRYVELAGMPEFAFTPDGSFPITIGEKGALMLEVEGDYRGVVERLEGGVQCNVISPHASAVLPRSFEIQGELSQISTEIQEYEDHIFLSTEVISAHASRPEDGHNATVDLLKVLRDLTGEVIFEELFNVFEDPYGEGAGIAAEIPPMGKLSMNLGVLKINDGTLYAQIDIRYPYGCTSEWIHSSLQSALPSLRVTMPYDDPPTLLKEDDPFLIPLKQAYEAVTGKPCGMKISGGVSYSKVFGHCVNFGDLKEETPALQHQRNESVPLADLYEALKIYYNTLKLLGGGTL